MSRRFAGAGALAALAIVAAGCGGDDGEEPVVTPASVVPADAVVYADATLRPEGEERTAVEAPLAALLDTEAPGEVLVSELDRSLAELDPALDYAEDVEPWLGERGAAFLLEPPAEGAFVLDTTDPEAAQDFADELGGSTPARVVGDYLVVGSERAVAAVADTEAGGEALADDPDYSGVMGDDVGATATLFADVPALVDAGALDAGDREALEAVFGGLADEPLSAALDAETTGFAVEVAHGEGELPPLSAAAESALLRELPEDTWLAAGLADAGRTIGSVLGSARELGVGEDELESTREEFRRELGLELEDIYEPLGDGAAFASGQGIFGAGGGLVFEADDPEGAKRLVDGLERAAKRGGEEVRSLRGSGGAKGFSVDVPSAPGAVNFVAGSDRLVVAYGEQAAVAALDPGQAEGSLGESERFTAAESALGEDYDVGAFVDFGPVADLLQLASATAPGLEPAMPYLEALDFLIAGSRTDGDRVRHRAYLGISGITTEPSE